MAKTRLLRPDNRMRMPKAALTPGFKAYAAT